VPELFQESTTSSKEVREPDTARKSIFPTPPLFGFPLPQRRRNSAAAREQASRAVADALVETVEQSMTMRGADVFVRENSEGGPFRTSSSWASRRHHHEDDVAVRKVPGVVDDARAEFTEDFGARARTRSLRAVRCSGDEPLGHRASHFVHTQSNQCALVSSSVGLLHRRVPGAGGFE